jgi:hypothetical protein
LEKLTASIFTEENENNSKTLTNNSETTVLTIKSELAISSNGIMPIPNLMKIHPVVLELKHADGHNHPDECYYMHILLRKYKSHKQIQRLTILIDTTH